MCWQFQSIFLHFLNSVSHLVVIPLPCGAHLNYISVKKQQYTILKYGASDIFTCCVSHLKQVAEKHNKAKKKIS